MQVIIEITQNVPSSDWWQSWLPLLGSIVVALATVTGVVLSNRHAGGRDVGNWRRTAILPRIADILDLSRRMNVEAATGLSTLKIDPHTGQGVWLTKEEKTEARERSTEMQREMATHRRELRLLAGKELMEAVENLYEAHVRLRGVAWYENASSDEFGDTRHNRKVRFNTLDALITGAAKRDLGNVEKTWFSWPFTLPARFKKKPGKQDQERISGSIENNPGTKSSTPLDSPDQPEEDTPPQPGEG